jgi:hypothetical protein
VVVGKYNGDFDRQRLGEAATIGFEGVVPAVRPAGSVSGETFGKKLSGAVSVASTVEGSSDRAGVPVYMRWKHPPG